MRKNGFTLIEVLIALAILAIALTAVIKATEDNSRNTLTLQNRIISHWVGMNLIAQMQLGVLPLPTKGNSNGTTQMLNHTWYWTANIINNTRNILQISINIAADKNGRPITKLIGFILQT